MPLRLGGPASQIGCDDVCTQLLYHPITGCMCTLNLHVCLPMQFMSCRCTLPFRCSFYRRIECSIGRGGFARHMCSAVPTASTLRSYLITDACGCRASKCNLDYIELHIAPGLLSHTACWLSALIILAFTIIRTYQIPYHVSATVFYLLFQLSYITPCAWYQLEP